MRFATPDRTPSFFVAPADPWPVTVEVEVAGVGRARRTVHRQSARAGAVGRSIDDYPGLFFDAAGRTRRRGSAGSRLLGRLGRVRLPIAHAALLASHGYAALAASYISEEAADKALSSVPLERFVAALRFLGDHDRVAAGRVAAMAISRGAEGLLAAASRAADLPGDLGCRGLILMSPSSLSWQAIGGNGSIPDTPELDLAGQEVPWAPLPTRAVDAADHSQRLEDRSGHRQAPPTMLRAPAA